MALARAAARRAAEQKKKEEAKDSAVEIIVLKPGDAFNFPKSGDSLSVHYTAELVQTGEAIDDSYKRGQPINFQLGSGHVVPG